MTHITEPYSHRLEDHIDDMIQNSLCEDIIFLENKNHTSEVKSLSIKLEKQDDTYLCRLCYQDEGDGYHDVFYGDCEYVPDTIITGKLVGKYDPECLIDVNRAKSEFFRCNTIEEDIKEIIALLNDYVYSVDTSMIKGDDTKLYGQADEILQNLLHGSHDYDVDIVCKVEDIMDKY